MISVTNLEKRFGNFEAVRKINFHVGKGEIVALLGPNGAGKTTTMRMLTGFYEPTEGSVQIGGVNILQDRRAVQKMIGYLPENASSYPEMLVSEFLNFIADTRQMDSTAKLSGIQKAVQVTGLESYFYRPIMHLSKGYKQRVGLAAALLHDPQILILDEPTSGLDPNQIIEIQNLIRSLAKEKTIILSTHILKEVEETCDRAIIISEGKIVLDEKLSKLSNLKENTESWNLTLKGTLTNASDRIRSAIPNTTQIDLISSNDRETCLKITGETGLNEKLFQLAVSEKWVIREMRLEKQSIESVFTRLTTTSTGGNP